MQVPSLDERRFLTTLPRGEGCALYWWLTWLWKRWCFPHYGVGNSLRKDPRNCQSPPFLPPSWHTVWSYRPHLELRDPIWGDDCSHSLHRRSLSWDFRRVPSVLSEIAGDLCTAPVSSNFHPYHYLTGVTDMILGASGFCLGTRIGAGGTTTVP